MSTRSRNSSTWKCRRGFSRKKRSTTGAPARGDARPAFRRRSARGPTTPQISFPVAVFLACVLAPRITSVRAFLAISKARSQTPIQNGRYYRANPPPGKKNPYAIIRVALAIKPVYCVPEKSNEHPQDGENLV